MNYFERSGGEDFSDAMIDMAARDFMDNPELADNCREEAAEHLADVLRIDLPAARGIVWDREEDLRDRIASGKA